MGDVTARFADVMDSELLKGAVSDLVEQLDREATRCSALRALAVIANSPRQSSTATLVLEKGGLGTLSSFLEHHARPLQQATLEALGALLRTLPPKSKLKAGDVAYYLDECVNLAKDSDLHLAHLATKTIAAAITNCSLDKKAKTACENDVLPAALTLAASPLLQGAPLDGLADVFEAIALKGGGGALGFDALLSALPDAARVAKEEDPVRGSRQARKNVAVVIARLCAAADASTLKKAVANLREPSRRREQAPGRHRSRGTGEKVRPVEARRDINTDGLFRSGRRRRRRRGEDRRRGGSRFVCCGRAARAGWAARCSTRTRARASTCC